MKTIIWTSQDYSRMSQGPDPRNMDAFEAGRPRCIFNGDAPQLRKGDQIVIRDGIVERVASSIYDLEDGTQEVALETEDRDRIYATIPYSS